MPYPFHWLFRRATWTRCLDTCFPERKVRRERLAALVGQLNESKKLTNDEIASLFKARFGVSLRFTAQGVVMENMGERNFEEVAGHFEQFCKSQFRDHESFCQKLLKDALDKRLAAKAFERGLVRAINAHKSASKSSDTPKPMFSEGAIRGLYMGQMLNQRHETNEQLERLRDMLD